MKKIGFAIIFICILSLLLCSCKQDDGNLGYINMPQKVTQFNFSGYDTLKISLSENEYITLTAEEDYTWTHSENGSVWHGGRGKWVDENGETPIWFEETPQGDPLASYGGYAYRGFMIYSEEGSSNSPIAMLISDTENPRLVYYLGADNSDVSNVWSDPVSVTAEAIIN